MFQQHLRFLCRTLLCLVLVAGMAPVAAHADDYYSYSFSGSGVSGSGTVGLVSAGTNGVYQVTYIDGQVNNQTINGLLQPGTYKNNDNLFYQGGSYVDASGVSFDLKDNSGTQLNIYYDGSDYYFQGQGTFPLDGGSGPFVSRFSRFASFSASSSPSDVNVRLDQFSFAPQAETATTPEPSGLALLGTGALATAGMLRRRFAGA